MKKTRRLLAIVTAIFITASLSAANDMNIIPLSSPLYDYVDTLYTLEGHAAAQGARPWTEADFRQQLSRIEPSSPAAEELYDVILREAVAVGVGYASPERIDEINILQATYEAMREAVSKLSETPAVLLNDAVTIPGISIRL